MKIKTGPKKIYVARQGFLPIHLSKLPGVCGNCHTESPELVVLTGTIQIGKRVVDFALPRCKVCEGMHHQFVAEAS
jgi:hypothetical protein